MVPTFVFLLGVCLFFMGLVSAAFIVGGIAAMVVLLAGAAFSVLASAVFLRPITAVMSEGGATTLGTGTYRKLLRRNT